MVMALEAKIPVSGIQRLILQGTRGCKEGKHGKMCYYIGCKSSFPGRQLWSWKSPWPSALESHGGGVPHSAQEHEIELSLFVLHSHRDTGRWASQKWCDLKDHKISGNPNWTQPHCARRQSYKLWEIKSISTGFCRAVEVLLWAKQLLSYHHKVRT